MKIFAIITALLCTLSHAIADNKVTNEAMNLKIKTVDEKNNLFPVQRVKWWYSTKQKEKHLLKCDTDKCAEWEISGDISSLIVIHADASIVQKNDPYCWDFYRGEVIIEMPTQETTITMSYQSTACS